MRNGAEGKNRKNISIKYLTEEQKRGEAFPQDIIRYRRANH